MHWERWNLAKGPPQREEGQAHDCSTGWHLGRMAEMIINRKKISSNDLRRFSLVTSSGRVMGISI
jgi:hypothetical protein